jgi:hypothetical protein
MQNITREQTIKLAGEALDYAKIYNVPLDTALDHVGAPLSSNCRATMQFHIAKKLGKPIEKLFK